ncbi:MAG: TorF family putative porin [Sulfuricella denitrificans]|nr:TorF family putative porin [Sulfuricella denitrificans]
MTTRTSCSSVILCNFSWLIAVAGAPLAHAGEISAYTLTSNIGAASDYISRGLRLNWHQPAIQGGAELVHRSGGYISTSFSQVTDQFYANGSVELDLYAGLRQSSGDGLSYDIGLGAYFYPGANYRDAFPKGTYPGQRYDTAEAIFGMTYRWLNLKYSYSLTDYYGYDGRTVPLSVWNSGVFGGVAPGHGTRGSGYLEANASFDAGHEMSIGLHAGHQAVAHSSKLSYSDYRISGTKSLPQEWLVTLALSGTSGAEIYNNFLSVSGNGQTLDIGGTHWTLSASKTF